MIKPHELEIRRIENALVENEYVEIDNKEILKLAKEAGYWILAMNFGNYQIKVPAKSYTSYVASIYGNEYLHNIEYVEDLKKAGYIVALCKQPDELSTVVGRVIESGCPKEVLEFLLKINNMEIV